MIIDILLSSVLTFLSPVNFDVLLAGNFGEPRPHHFHGGIDVKTERLEGKPILSIGGGYVSRIVVGLYGYGNAIYIHHPEGYTSMYCHLKRFSPQIESISRMWQYKMQNYSIDVKLKPTDCPISKGQLIATSGNTGASKAPHLHMEIYDDYTGMMVDPLEFIGIFIKDTISPKANGFMAYPQNGKGVFCGEGHKQNFSFVPLDTTRKYTAWGQVGFGIWANDYMDNTCNHYGIRETELTVDGKVIFHKIYDGIYASDTRAVNFLGDYDSYMRYGVWYIKSFIEPGINLPFIKKAINRGIVFFNKEKEYHLLYKITDFAGNKNEYRFIVEGKKTDIALNPSKNNLLKLMEWRKTNIFRTNDVELFIKQKSLANDIILHPKMIKGKGAYSTKYRFHNKSYPLMKWAKIRLKCTGSVKDTHKLYIKGKQNSVYNQFEYKDGWVTGFIRDLGTSYEIAYDDTPPKISEIKPYKWMIDKIIRLNVIDHDSGIKEIKAFIDGKFVLFENVDKSHQIECHINKTHLSRKNKLRQLVIIATDNTNNVSTYSSNIKY